MQAPEGTATHTMEGDETQKKTKNQSIMLRAKKFIASQTSRTKYGKKLINTFIGEESENVAKILTTIITELKDEKTATEARDNLYRLATKFNILIEEKELTWEHTAHAESPLNNFAVQILSALSTQKNDAKRDSDEKQGFSGPRIHSPNIKVLRSNIERIRVMIVEIARGHITDKNLKVLDELFDIYGLELIRNEEVLDSLLKKPEYEDHKKNLYKNLSAILPEQTQILKKLRDLAKPIPCRVPGCPCFAVSHQGQFLLSGLCAFHHFMLFKDVIEKPQFKKYMSTGMDVIISKYLRVKNTTNFIHVDESKIEALLKVLKDLDDADPVDAKLAGTRYAEKAIFNVPSKEIFDDIEKQVWKTMETIFDQSYLKSGVHRLYLATIKLPPYHWKKAQKIYEEKTEQGVLEKETQVASKVKMYVTS
eukprot:jgi/Bigna1/86564/estExt_fgenesh1_pg.C_110228